MPTYKNIEVVITDSKGRALNELGIRTNARQQETSCYIESAAGQYFQIGIKPIGPFASREKKGKAWQLVATIRFDGRETPESAMMLMVDEDHDYYPRPADGRVMIGEKKIRGRDGIIRKHRWQFQDIGIESLLEEVALNKAEVSEEDELMNALKGMGSNFEEKEEKTSAGTIEVSFQRVMLEGKVYDRVDNESDMEESAVKRDRHIDHTAKRDSGTRSSAADSRFIHYTAIDPDTVPYAKFKFFYRKAEVLRKLGFPGFEGPRDIPRATLQETTVNMGCLPSIQSKRTAADDGYGSPRKKEKTNESMPKDAFDLRNHSPHTPSHDDDSEDDMDDTPSKRRSLYKNSDGLDYQIDDNDEEAEAEEKEQAEKEAYQRDAENEHLNRFE